MKFRPSSNQFMPTSCQLRVGQYARTISNDSPAPHSYDPTMGRRQRRQPINPPRHRRMGVLDPGSTSLRRASAKLNGRAAALAGPPTFGQPFAPRSTLGSSSILNPARGSSILNLQISAILNPQSSIHHSADICNPQSSILNPQSTMRSVARR